MGYNLHITRKQMHFDTLGPVIREEEWTTYVKNDPELKLAGFNGPFFSLWSGKCSYEEPWFDWFDGNIKTKNPDHAMIRKMLKIAKALNAKVQGDDGEIYVLEDNAIISYQNGDRFCITCEQKTSCPHQCFERNAETNDTAKTILQRTKSWLRNLFNPL